MVCSELCCLPASKKNWRCLVPIREMQFVDLGSFCSSELESNIWLQCRSTGVISVATVQMHRTARWPWLQMLLNRWFRKYHAVCSSEEQQVKVQETSLLTSQLQLDSTGTQPRNQHQFCGNVLVLSPNCMPGSFCKYGQWPRLSCCQPNRCTNWVSHFAARFKKANLD